MQNNGLNITKPSQRCIETINYKQLIIKIVCFWLLVLEDSLVISIKFVDVDARILIHHATCPPLLEERGKRGMGG